MGLEVACPSASCWLGTWSRRLPGLRDAAKNTRRSARRAHTVPVAPVCGGRCRAGTERAHCVVPRHRRSSNITGHISGSATCHSPGQAGALSFSQGFFNRTMPAAVLPLGVAKSLWVPHWLARSGRIRSLAGSTVMRSYTAAANRLRK